MRPFGHLLLALAINGPLLAATLAGPQATGVAPPEAPATDTDVPEPTDDDSDGSIRVILGSLLGLAIGFFGAIVVLSSRRPGAA